MIDQAELMAALVAAESKVRELEAAISAFVVTAEAAIRHHRGPRGGQHVTFFGDFAHMTPSDSARLEWWANRFKAAIKKGPTT